MPPFITIIVLSAFPALLIVAALRDATSMTIPNWISIALAAAFAPAALAAGLGVAEALACLGVGIAALAIGVALFALRWIGGGDAKLLAAAALWLGLPGIASFLLWTALAGGALALVLLSARRFAALSGLPAAPPAWLARLLKPEGDIPYGIAIAAGALAAFTQSPLTQAWSG
jgi:prepilin peptidase CpaA